MKIMKIEPHASYGVCDDLLAKGFYSDALFDRCFIDVTIDVGDNVESIFYRKLWEDTYIKIAHPATHINPQNMTELVVSITLSEAIGFIYRATPPRLQYNIKDSHKDIATIIETLKTFLFGEQAYITFTSMFYEHIHLTAQDMKQENFAKLKAGADVIKSKLPHDKLYGFYVYASTHSIETLAEGKDMAGSGSSVTMVCVKLDKSYTPEMIDLFKKITDYGSYDDSVNVKIDNIKATEGSLYVSLMIVIDSSAGSYDYMPGPFARIIKYSYENL